MHAVSYRKGQLEKGLPISVMVNAMKTASKANPDATVKDIMDQMLLYWSPSSGKGRAVIQVEGQADRVIDMPYQSGKRKKDEAVMIQVPCVLRLVPEEGEGLTVNVAASGTYTVVAGAETEAQAVLPVQEHLSSLENSARNWLREGEVGSSAYALCVALTGVVDPQRRAPAATDVPWDHCDFDRCVKFFKAVPEARPLLERMSEQGPQWASLVPVWGELENFHAYGENAAVRDRIHETLEAVFEARRAKETGGTVEDIGIQGNRGRKPAC